NVQWEKVPARSVAETKIYLRQCRRCRGSPFVPVVDRMGQDPIDLPPKLIEFYIAITGARVAVIFDIAVERYDTLAVGRSSNTIRIRLIDQFDLSYRIVLNEGVRRAACNYFHRIEMDFHTFHHNVRRQKSIHREVMGIEDTIMRYANFAHFICTPLDCKNA